MRRKGASKNKSMKEVVKNLRKEKDMKDSNTDTGK